MTHLARLLVLVGLLFPTPLRAEAIAGRIEFNGAAPPAAPPRHETDPWCKGKGLSDESFLHDGARLQNVWVRVVKGAKDELGSPDKTVSITQRDCRYQPRMVAMQAGNTLLVRNEDPVLHNTHVYSSGSTLFNRAMPGGEGKPPISITFDSRSSQSTARWEGPIKWKCDVHPWMTAVLGVSRNPYYAISAVDGTFRIEGIPPGQYTLSAWHETLGERMLEITVAPGQQAEAFFQLGVQPSLGTQ